jgi:MIP family channel proteins
MPSSLKRYVAELVGTFALVAVGPGAVMVSASTHAFGHVGVALAFGLVITICVAATGHLSGAHINPAVTIGFWSVGRFPARDVVPYVIAQTMGAIVAAALLRWLLGPIASVGATVPTLSVARAFVVELGYSGLLAFVIMAVATEESSPPAVAPFAIGATVFAGALVTGPLTGGSFNPARSLGPAIVSSEWTAHWVYWVAPITGMVMAMRLYELLRPRALPLLGAPRRDRSARPNIAGGRDSTKDTNQAKTARIEPHRERIVAPRMACLCHKREVFIFDYLYLGRLRRERLSRQ